MDLLHSEGDFHRHQRRLIQPAFHRHNIMKYADIAIEHGSQICKRWEDGTTADIHRELMQLTLPIVTRILFGTDTKGKDTEISEAVTTVLEYFNRVALPFGEFFEKLSLGSNRRFELAKSKLDMILYGIIDKRRADRGRDRNKEDLISILLQAQDTELERGSGGRDLSRGKMTDLQLRDEIMTIFLAATNQWQIL